VTTFTDGTGTAVDINNPQGIAADGNGILYVAGSSGRIQKIIIATGEVTTLAGSNTSGSADGPGTTALFNLPMDIAIDGNGNLYVADGWNHRIRKITQ
jgi:sugar lactone lactonase YvrE